jgi:class 3 adenylate cyclase
MSEAPEVLHVDERRLAAILAADVAGYSRLMGRNEEETVRDLEAHQAAILPLIAKHGGSIINTAGDGVVAQFPSAVRAVECAVAMQKIMTERNFDVPSDRRMLLRIGVNLGDIIHDGTRTYGDGINVAGGSSRSPSPAASASHRRCAKRSSASSACPCAMSERNRSRTSPGRCTSIRSNRLGRQLDMTG